MDPRDAKIARRTTVDAEPSNFAGDRLTGLPEHIIHRIFSFLETIDVIRASAVSRNWRYLWISIPFFNFNIHTVWSDPFKFGPISSIVERFNNFVNWVFMFHDGSTSIEKFQLECLALENDYSVNRWIHVAARRNVKELDLFLDLQTHFEIPFSLVNCESLVVLKLNLSERPLMLPTFTGFSRLETLELVSLELTDETLTQRLIRDCSVLENLRMEGCAYRDFKVLGIFSTSLKSLTIDILAVSDDDKNLIKGRLKVACPNLVSFTFMGPPLLDFSFQGLLSLEYALMYVENRGFYLTEREYGFVMCNALRGLQNTKTLTLSFPFILYLEAAITTSVIPCASLFNLKSLKLHICMHECYIKPLISLLNGSPNVEALLIQFEETEWDGLWEVPDKPITCLTYNLKMVELIDVVGNENELEVIKFLLKHGKAMEKMDINWRDDAVDTEKTRQEVEWIGQWEFPDKPMTCLTHHLKMVELIGVVGNENELELNRYLLKHGKVLEKMHIAWYKHAEDMQEPMRKLMLFKYD